MRNNKKKAIGLVLAWAIFITASGGNSASAANGWEIPLNTTTTTTSQTSSSVSLSLSSGTIQTDLDAASASTNPDEAGKVLSQTATITVGNTDGYTVYVSGNTNLTGRNNTSHKIPSITSSKTLGSMSNEWGYYATLGDSEASWNPSTSFKAMTTSQQSVGTGGATNSSVTKKLTLFYGARVTSSAAEDFYGNTVTLSVVAQPRTVTNTVATFGGITTMQEMTPEICAAAEVNDTAYLRDTRDGKYYWVTKMLGSTATAKDGECWMSQNLDLDLSTSKALTSTDSDVASNWTPGQNTQTSVTVGSTTPTETYSWDLGQYVINVPTGTTACASNATGLASCTMFTDVAGWTASDDPNFYKNNNGSSVNASTKTYDAHYLVGNYYQWNAVTAGTGGEIVGQNATGSICPKNWKLPSSATSASTIVKGTYVYLLQQYGLASAYNSGSSTGTSSVNSNTYNITQSPLFFVQGGAISPNMAFDKFGSAGKTGEYWSSLAHSSGTSSAYRLVVSSDNVRPFASAGRYHGFFLRCLIPTT